MFKPFHLSRLLRHSLALFLCILPFGCLLLYMTLVDSYWNFYEMGINEDANMLGFFLVQTPFTLMLLYGSLAACWLVMHHLRRPIWQTFLLAMLAYILVILAMFFAEIAQTADTRISSGQSLRMFFQAYLDQWSIFLGNVL